HVWYWRTSRCRCCGGTSDTATQCTSASASSSGRLKQRQSLYILNLLLPLSFPSPTQINSKSKSNSRYNSSERTVRWNEANDDEEDFHFEDVDSPNPMYLSHNLH
ncbi:uncharacterized protein Dwil_GK28234, partial [Drosophila willistoni]